ncbi:MAG: macro domain-containing protein [Candidatus Zixiibacteriota bacterium]
MGYEIVITQGDITKADTQAIVNAANNQFWMGAGVAGAIKAAGGDVIEEEAMNKGPVMPGEAVYTGAGKLPLKYVIHAAVMGQDGRTSDRLIRHATIASLNIAEKLKIDSLAFPAFGTGVGGFPMKACAHVMVSAVDNYRAMARHLQQVQFILFDSYGYTLFKEKLATRLR